MRGRLRGKEREMNPSTGMWKLALAIGGSQ